MKILYYGSCWPTNIGNAFVNWGAIAALRRAVGDRARVYHFGGLSSYLFMVHGRGGNNLAIAEWADFDYVVMGGMTQSEEHFRSAGPLLEGFLKKGTRLVIAGGGAERYDDDEVRAVRQWMDRYPVYGFISRDSYSYERYGDAATHALDGIDSAFFVPQGFDPIPLASRAFSVFAFDTMAEPTALHVGDEPAGRGEADHAPPDPPARAGLGWLVNGANRRVRSAVGAARGRGRRGGLPANDATVDLEGRRLVRTHHSPWPTSLREEYLARPNTLISDLPSDFLSLYAQAHTVYSDRVHACIAALAFGNRAMLFGRDIPRLRMFERLGLSEIVQRPVRLEPERLRREGDAQVEFLRRVLV